MCIFQAHVFIKKTLSFQLVQPCTDLNERFFDLFPLNEAVIMMVGMLYFTDRKSGAPNDSLLHWDCGTCLKMAGYLKKGQKYVYRYNTVLPFMVSGLFSSQSFIDRIYIQRADSMLSLQSNKWN